MIILTGGAGFIGSCFLSKLNQEGVEDILVVDHLDSSEKWRNLAGKSFIDYVQKDDFLRMVQERKLPRPKAVVHMGACSSTTCTDADYFIKNNYEYSKVLAEWTLKSKVPFIYASSAATYGDGSAGYSDKVDSIKGLKPLNMYGLSKHMFDMWVLSSGLIGKVTGIKFFNVFGPNEYHKGDMMSVICKKFRQVRDKGKITLFKSYDPEYADGEQKRDFIYIKDVVDVMYHLLNNPDKTGIFNLGTGKARSWNDLAGAMFAALGKEPVIEYVEMPEDIRPKYQYFTQAEMARLKGTGYSRTFRELEDSVKDYIGYLSKEAYL
ncbi:MAG: ADP-glyceromanno-heptose 6-epimerase [Candidatus Omnitrophica bacterium]|nr:ADP-glyceromanno-heptose 6-epimerase [Candidatus Omnitrophota bacterium]MDD5488592.1 ADP-glyceromanno-heptose 6-epimerase [Candidatus Omnitrophota bacterium]